MAEKLRTVGIIERLPNIREVEAVGGIVRLVGSKHPRSSDTPETYRTPNTEREIGPHAHLVCAEMFLDATGGLPHFDPKVWAEDVRAASEEDLQYRAVFIAARRRDIPVCGVDLPISNSLSDLDGLEQVERKDRGVELLFLAAGLAAASAWPKSMTRRTFLRYTTSGVAAIGVYLSAPAFIRDIKPDPTHPANAPLNDILHRIKDWQGLGRFVIRLRNLVMAHKLSFLVERERREHPERKPQLTMFVGAEHVPGLADALHVDAKERLQFIQALVEEMQRLDSERGSTVADMVNLIPVAYPDSSTPEGWRGERLDVRTD